MSLLGICQLIQESQVGTSLRESDYMFPLVETLHVLGLSASVGTIIWFDLRLLGVGMRDEPVSAVWDQVKSWMLGGFTLMFLTGALLFWAQAADCYASLFFRIKVAGLLLAGVNALYFTFHIQRDIADWDRAPVPPVGVRVAGLLSIVLWAVIIAAGRLMAYSFGAAT